MNMSEPQYPNNSNIIKQTSSLLRPCSRILRAILWACSFVLRTLMLYAIRNFLAPTAVAPHDGTNSDGPKSGFHSSLVSCKMILIY